MRPENDDTPGGSGVSGTASCPPQDTAFDSSSTRDLDRIPTVEECLHRGDRRGAEIVARVRHVAALAAEAIQSGWDRRGDGESYSEDEQRADIVEAIYWFIAEREEWHDAELAHERGQVRQLQEAAPHAWAYRTQRRQIAVLREALELKEGEVLRVKMENDQIRKERDEARAVARALRHK